MWSRNGKSKAYQEQKTVDNLSSASSERVPAFATKPRTPPPGAVGGPSYNEPLSPMNEIEEPMPTFTPASRTSTIGPPHPPGGPLSSHSPRDSLVPGPPISSVMNPGSLMGSTTVMPGPPTARSSPGHSRTPSRGNAGASVGTAMPWEGTGPQDPRGTAWTEIGTVPSRDSLREPMYPSRTVRVENTVEIV